jgi:hypothetical protein
MTTVNLNALTGREPKQSFAHLSYLFFSVSTDSTFWFFIIQSPNNTQIQAQKTPPYFRGASDKSTSRSKESNEDKLA